MSSLTDLQPLVRAVGSGDVDAGILSDEEVHWIGPDPTAPPDGFIDAPRLAGLSSHDQQVALQAALLILQARGDVLYERDEDVYKAVGGHALLSHVRNAPQAAASVRVDTRGQGTTRAAVYRVRSDLFLVEEVAEAGLHHFVFRSAPRTARWLAATVDPHGRAGPIGPALTAANVDDLDPHPQYLADTCETSAFVYYDSRHSDGHSAQRSFTCYAGTDGVYVLAGWQTPSDGQVTLQLLPAGDLLGFCAAFLSPSGDTAPSSN
ncbi:MAG: hypothetical protein M3O70_02690 [Actinomycetota bacterium]|nr:hypothetical protein [Actinomycetota bacterium]